MFLPSQAPRSVNVAQSSFPQRATSFPGYARTIASLGPTYSERVIHSIENNGILRLVSGSHQWCSRASCLVSVSAQLNRREQWRRQNRTRTSLGIGGAGILFHVQQAYQALQAAKVCSSINSADSELISPLEQQRSGIFSKFKFDSSANTTSRVSQQISPGALHNDQICCGTRRARASYNINNDFTGNLYRDLIGAA